jgi:hypothetical protein
MRRDDHGGRRGAVAALRREAIAERPPFSEAFHDRLVRRLSACSSLPPVPRPVAPLATQPVPVRRAVLPVAAAVVAVVILLVARFDREAPPDRSPVPTGEGGVAPRAVSSLGNGELDQVMTGQEREPVGIDRLPTFDELEESVAEGVTTLMVSVLEVPEWTALADWDAGSILGGGTR